MGARQCHSTAVVRPAGVAEDTVLSNGVARGGRQRLPPDAAQWRSACPNPKLPGLDPDPADPKETLNALNEMKASASLDPELC